MCLWKILDTLVFSCIIAYSKSSINTYNKMTHKPQILFVTGKGGVGKTSTALMLGLAQAERGIKTVIVQTNGAQQVSPYFGLPLCGYVPQEVHPNLFVMRITAAQAIEEYAIMQLKFRKLYEIIFENRFAKPLIQGAPGLHDAVHLGKIYGLAEREKWPSIIVDAPATGHALSMLRSARTMMELTKSGPMYKSNAIVDDILSDPSRTSIVLVTLLEELPVQETRELWNNLGKQRAQCRLLVQNKVLTAPPTSEHSLSNEWKNQVGMLLTKYHSQQRQRDLLRSISCAQSQIPSLPKMDIKAWSTWGELLIQQIQGAAS